MATITKTLSAKVVNDYSNVLFRLSVSRTLRLRIKTGVFVPVKYWNEKKGTIKVPDVIPETTFEELKALKARLDNIETKVYDLLRLFPDEITKSWLEKVLPIVEKFSSTEMTKQNILLAIDKHDYPDKYKVSNLYELAETFLAKKKYAYGRERQYRVLLRCACRYEVFCNEIQKHPFKWIIDECQRKDIENFFDYLSKEHLYRVQYANVFDELLKEYPLENTPKHKTTCMSQRCENTLIGMKKRWKCFWLWLIAEGYTKNNPFEGLLFGLERYGTPFYLTTEERNQVANFDLSEFPDLEIQRDIFIFQCWVGCRVSDLYSFKKANIVNDVLIYMPHKTKDEMDAFLARVPLSEKAKQLIDKYKGQTKRGKLFPFISKDKYNDAIKKVLTVCKVKRMVSVKDPITGEDEMKPLNEVSTSHTARKTFIGNLYKEVQDPNIIGRMSGHVEGSKAFTRYRAIDDDILKNAIKKIE